MWKKNLISATLAVSAVFGTTNAAPAQDPPDLFLEHLSDYTWIGASGGTWQTAGNWTADADPAPVEPSLSLGYPNDPGRDDTVPTDIVPVIGANFSKPLASDLTINITGGNVTVASVKLGGTSSAVTTAIASASNMLVFENQESNDEVTNPGNPDAEPPILAEPIYGFNQGRALIWSTGTAGVGKENRINANILANDDIDVEGNRDLHIYGNIHEGDRLTVGGAVGRPSSISSLLTGGAKLVIHGNIHVTEFDDVPDDPNMPVTEGTQDRSFNINSARGIRVPVRPQVPPADPPTRQGFVEFLGHFVGSGPEAEDHGGWVQIGSGESSRHPLGNVILRGDSVGPDPENPRYDGRIVVNRTNLVLAHDNALGAGDMISGNPSPAVGFNFISDNDNRKIATAVQLAQWHTVRGASDIKGLEGIGDHSIEFSGEVGQTNTRGWINLLPAGKQLVLSGPQYALDGGTNQDLDRLYTVDGTGLTRITGGLHNRPPDGEFAGNGHFRKRGTGTVILNYAETVEDPDNPGMMIPNPNPVTDNLGALWMEGGNLHFGAVNDLPGDAIHSNGGAVGIDGGVFSPAGDAMLAKLNSSSAPNHGTSGTGYFSTPFFRTINVTTPVLTTYSSGGLMLATGEYGMDLDFNSGSLANAANMTLAAREGGSTYTGEITPSTTAATNKDTYQLGGGAGRLTLPEDGQLTGARNLLVTNGGEVRLEGANNYTGVTKIQGKFWTSLQSDAKENRLGDGDETDDYVSTTLTVTKLADGASSLGNSTLSNAGNVMIQGGTLKYDGTTAVSTSRLFTVGTAGATVDASGDGPLTFSSTAALGVDVAEPRAGVITSQTPGTNAPRNLIFGRSSASAAFTFNTEDLVPGIRIASVPSAAVNFQPGLAITSVPETDVISVGLEGWTGWTGTSTSTTPITFGPAPARFLTLTGENTGNNTLAPLIGDASDIGNANEEFDEVSDGHGTVGIRKTGLGKWVLTANNTYSGDTDVEAGTLIINGVQTGTGTTTVKSGAALGGGGTLGGPLLSSGTVAPGFNGTATMTVNGNYTQSASATLAIEIGGTGAGAFDRLNVLEGASTISPPIEGDYNEDGAVDAADYTVWRNLEGQMVQLPNEGEEASPGVVDQADYAVWKGNFGTKDIGLGLATVSGTINIDLINGFTPTPGNMFTILSANEGLSAAGITLSGESAGFSLITNPTSLVLHYLGGGSGSLLAGAVPEPTGLMLAGMTMFGLGLTRRRR